MTPSAFKCNVAVQESLNPLEPHCRICVLMISDLRQEFGCKELVWGGGGSGVTSGSTVSAWGHETGRGRFLSRFRPGPRGSVHPPAQSETRRAVSDSAPHRPTRRWGLWGIYPPAPIPHYSGVTPGMLTLQHFQPDPRSRDTCTQRPRKLAKNGGPLSGNPAGRREACG